MIGTSNENPILNTVVYTVETADEHIDEYTENVIHDNIYSQVDRYGYNYGMLYESVEHRKTDVSIPKESGYYFTRTEVKSRSTTTKGWQLKVKWESVENSYIALKDINNANPLEMV